MGKIIAVWGTPNSGKTAFTMKLAGHLYETGRRRQTSLFDDGLHLFEGTFLNPKAEMSFSWQTTRELIEALIKDNNYLDEPMPETLAKTAVIEKPEPVKQNFAVSQEVIDGFLRLGGCTSRSNYRIYGFYRRANNKEENIRFLRAEYETDAIGLIVNGQTATALDTSSFEIY